MTNSRLHEIRFETTGWIPQPWQEHSRALFRTVTLANPSGEITTAVKRMVSDDLGRQIHGRYVWPVQYSLEGLTRT